MAVVKSLATAIVVGDYAPGSALPPASVLCEEYEVSRTVIREATTSLAEKGLVAARQGWGTVVLDQNQWNLLDPLILEALFQRDDRLVYLDSLIGVRIALECAMAAQAAERLDADDRVELAAKLDELGGLVDDPDAYMSLDLELHELIHRISGDAFGRAIVANIQGKALRSPQYTGHPTRDEIALTHAAHQRIVATLLAADSGGASDAMREHIASSWARRRPRESAEESPSPSSPSHT